jgi:uncharacterized protein (DUF1501 family)
MMSATELTRRKFLVHTGVATVAAGSVAVMRTAPVSASAPTTGRTLVVVFCRGGADGLSIVPPIGSPEYYTARPTIAVPPSAARALGGAHPSSMFGLHPAAARISALYDQGKVAIVNSAGLLVDTRSHFDAQAYMEAGVEDTTLSTTGWAGRWLAATASSSDHPLRSVAIGDALPASLRGGDAVAASGFGSLSLFSWGPSAALVTANTTDLYGRSGVHPLLTAWAQPTIDTIANIATLGSTDRPATFPDTQLGNNLWPIARLIEAGFPVEVAHADMDSWDTHDAMGSATDSGARMYGQVSELDTALGAFFDRIGSAADQVTVVVVTEFGRRTYENSSGGVDHGRGFPLLVIGGGVNGGVYGDWRGLADPELDDGDVAVTTDYRTVVAELMAKRLGATSTHLSGVFPRFAATSGWLGVAGT